MPFTTEGPDVTPPVTGGAAGSGGSTAGAAGTGAGGVDIGGGGAGGGMADGGSGVGGDVAGTSDMAAGRTGGGAMLGSAGGTSAPDAAESVDPGCACIAARSDALSVRALALVVLALVTGLWRRRAATDSTS